MTLFAKYAPSYWAKGFSVIPIEDGTKQPARSIKSWSSYCSNLPKPETRAEWLERYKNNGIGVLLGKSISSGFRLGAIDVDDDRYVKVVKAVLGPAPSAKRGKKGITYFVKVRGDVKSTKITDHEKAGKIDILINGRMTVQPPTEHPETRKPYVWIGLSLLEVPLEQLPVFDADKLKLIKTVVASENAAAFATGTATHEPGIRLAAELVRLTSDDDLITSIVRALLPEGYTGNSLEELHEWIASARAKGFGQPSDKSASISERLNALVDASGATLFHDEGKRGYFSVPIQGGIRHFGIRSSEGRLWLTKLFYDAHHKALSERTLDEAVNLLEARARFDSPKQPTFLRVGGDLKRIVVDLGHDDGRVVILTGDGWAVGYDSATKFCRSPGFASLPLPEPEGHLDALKQLLGLDDESWTLALAFILLCLRPCGPYMLLLVEGGQGSGKSFLCSIIKRIIDPNQVEKARLPDSERDLMIHAKDYHLLSFDNISGMKGDLSDAICVLSTGGGFATRKLYSDDELFVFNSTRPIVINGIADFATRPDLLERAIPLRLPSLSDTGRKTEQELLAEFNRILPSTLGCLYTIVVGALGADSTFPTPADIRMADCARWLIACEPYTGLDTGAFLSALRRAQDEVVVERALNDDVGARLLDMLERGPFESTILELLRTLTYLETPGRYFPSTPAQLSKHLVRLKPALQKAGIFVELGTRTNKGRTVRIWKAGQETHAPQAPCPAW